VIIAATAGLYLAEFRHANYEMALMAARTAVNDQQTQTPSWWESLLEFMGVDTTVLHSSLPMNLRMARGRLTGATTITDPATGFSAHKALRVQREVEMLQWTERKREGTANDKPTFTYSREWRSSPAMSSARFADNRAKEEHTNPPTAMEARGLGTTTLSGALDGIAVQNRWVVPAVAAQLADSCSHHAATEAGLPPDQRPRLPFAVHAGGSPREAGGWFARTRLYASADRRYWQSYPSREQALVGDIRMRFRVSAPTHAAVIGGTGSGGAIDAWVAPNGETIRLARGWRKGVDPDVSLVDVLDTAHAQNTWFLVAARLAAGAATLAAVAVACCTKHSPQESPPAGAGAAAPPASAPPASPARTHTQAATEDPPAHVEPPELPARAADGDHDPSPPPMESIEEVAAEPKPEEAAAEPRAGDVFAEPIARGAGSPQPDGVRSRLPASAGAETAADSPKLG